MDREYLCIDLKSFYASVECVDRGLDPLTTKLVVADESRSDNTICLAVSPAMKAMGIPGRPRLFEVRQKVEAYELSHRCKVDYVIATPRMKRYIDVSSEIYETYLEFVSPDDIHVYSIDEVFMDITEYKVLYEVTGRELAGRILRAVLDKTGITATVGLGTNLYLAKIAMDIVAKKTAPDEYGMRIAELDEFSFRRLLWDHTPITDFWRVGPGAAERLAGYGMYTMGDVARMSINNEELFYSIFGIDGEIVIDHAWGIEPCTMKDIKNYKNSSASLSSGQVLPRAYSFSQGLTVVKEMAEDLSLDMVSKNVVSQSFTLYVGYDKDNVVGDDYKGAVACDRYGRLMPKPVNGTANLGGFTSSSMRITEAFAGLYERLVDKRLTIRRLCLVANNIQYESVTGTQLDMFSILDESDSEKRLLQTVLDIRAKYGKNALLRGTNLQEGGTMIERNNQIGGHRA